MNKKSFVLFLLFLPAFLFLCVTVESRAEDNPAPRIFFPETVHDFGTIPRGGNVSHVFKVRNTGDAPLRLIKAKGS